MQIADDAACAAAIGRLGELDRQLAVIGAAKSEAVANATSKAEADALASARRQIEDAVAA